MFANGDAQVKNFSVIQTPQGDYRLAPAYDLINTLLHIPGGFIFALDKGLLPGWNSELGAYGSDFLAFGKLIGNSFLSDKLKSDYLQIHRTRVNSFLKVF